LDDFCGKAVSFLHIGIIHSGIIANCDLTWQYPKNASSRAHLHLAVFPGNGHCKGLSFEPNRCRIHDFTNISSILSLDATFPNDELPPPFCPIESRISFIPLHRTVNLVLPKFSSGSRPFKQMAVVTMPKTTVHRNNCSISGENQIWLSRKCLVVFSISEAFTKKCLSDQCVTSAHMAPPSPVC